MSIQDKMQYVVNRVFGDEKAYKVLITGDNAFEITNSDGSSYSRCSGKLIKNHWKESMATIIQLMADEKIRKALNELKDVHKARKLL